MLVLTRLPGASILIDGKIVVTIVATNGDSIRIGIEAPPEVNIVREELLPDSPNNALVVKNRCRGLRRYR